MKPSKAAVELAQEVYEVDTGHASDELSRIAQAIQDAVALLVEAAAGRVDGAALCAHQIKDRAFFEGRIYCFACLRAALKPWIGGEDGKNL